MNILLKTKTFEKMEEKKGDIGHEESYDSYFSRLLADNRDVPEEHLDEFMKFMDRQTRAFREVKDRNSVDGERAVELGFSNVEEYRRHVREEEEYRTRLVIATGLDNKHHLANTFLLEALFIETNLQDIDNLYPHLSGRAILGKNSHQIVFDIIYQTCRGFDRTMTSCIMGYFGVVDVVDTQRTLGYDQQQEDSIRHSDSEESDYE